ncbi:unnamed protein product [Mytilus coruscus]|uniref:Uncharacterized protein n=1 Tax=Mytilus coruscus TaxID=42192 RepID=A0A6J8E360_MYTCO|nr:unnamed protein product [Mytilus coruscus]
MYTDGKWKAGKIIQKHHTPRSYVVQTSDGRRYRRNRRHIRPTAYNDNTVEKEHFKNNQNTTVRKTSTVFNTSQTLDRSETVASEENENIEPSKSPVTRSGRTVKVPTKLNDYGVLQDPLDGLQDPLLFKNHASEIGPSIGSPVVCSSWRSTGSPGRSTGSLGGLQDPLLSEHYISTIGPSIGSPVGVLQDPLDGLQDPLDGLQDPLLFKNYASEIGPSIGSPVGVLQDPLDGLQDPVLFKNYASEIGPSIGSTVTCLQCQSLTSAMCDDFGTMPMTIPRGFSSVKGQNLATLAGKELYALVLAKFSEWKIKSIQMSQNMNSGTRYFKDVLFVEAEILVVSHIKKITVPEADRLLHPLPSLKR